MPKTINMPDTVELTFTYRTDGTKDKSEAITASVICDLSGLEEKDLLEWAYSNMIIGYQSKLRGKKPPTAIEEGENKGKYAWKVPARGSRTVADPAKVNEAAGKLLEKMDESAKKELLYKTLVSMGKSPTDATAISGYAPPAAPATPPAEEKKK